MSKQIEELVSNERILCEAITYLDEELNKYNILKKPISLQIISNFAILKDPIIGDREKFDKLINDISITFNLEKNWLNDDMSKSYIDYKNLEWNIGKLNFHTKLQLKFIEVETLDLTDLLKMKIISVDSIMISKNKNKEILNDLLSDIKVIMEHESLKINFLINNYSDFIVNKTTFDVINDSL